jgi:hypothetical protein
MKLLTLLLSLLLISPATAEDVSGGDYGKAIVKIEGRCSAVVVSKEGLVVTANHCGYTGLVNVEFPSGDSIKGQTTLRGYRPEGVTCVQLKLEKDQDIPYIPIYRRVYEGTGVLTGCGYFQAGDVLTKASVDYVGRTTNIHHGVEIDNMVDTTYGEGLGPGCSGGPLLIKTSEGERVLGLVSSGPYGAPHNVPEGATISWIPPEEVQRAVWYTEQTLIMFTQPNCRPCDIAKQAIAAQKNMPYNVMYVELKDGKWSHPELVAEFERKTGQKVTQTPTFWLKGTKHYNNFKSGFSLRGLFSWMLDIVKAIASPVFPDAKRPVTPGESHTPVVIGPEAIVPVPDPINPIIKAAAPVVGELVDPLIDKIDDPSVKDAVHAVADEVEDQVTTPGFDIWAIVLAGVMGFFGNTASRGIGNKIKNRVKDPIADVLDGPYGSIANTAIDAAQAVLPIPENIDAIIDKLQERGVVIEPPKQESE